MEVLEEEGKAYVIILPMCVHAQSLQSCQTLLYHGLQLARLLCPWNSPNKNTGAGCHTLLQNLAYAQLSFQPAEGEGD